MSRVIPLSLVGGLLLAALGGVGLANHAVLKAEPQVGHMVFFTLKDRSPAGREKLADLCRKYLGEHKGTTHFSVGTLAEDLKRDVNDQDWDVALHLVFQDQAAHDVYQTAPRHLEFIEQGKGLWAKVRVFDSYIPAAEASKK